MSGARERILASVRASLRRDAPLPESVARGLEARLAEPRPNLVPAIEGDLVARFVEKMEAVHGRVTRVASLDAVSEVVERHAREHGLPLDLVVAPGLDDVPWSNRFSVARRAANGDDRIGVARAFAGVAETGTLVLLSGPGDPTTINFVPEDHVVVLRESRVLAHLEDAWARLRAERGALPRTVNLITGPSKTGDVEQRIQEGAHGPRRLHVVLVQG